MLMVGTVDPTVGAHLKKALASHMRWCRDNGIAVPAEVNDLFMMVASDGLTRPTVGEERTVTHDADVALLTLTYDQAAKRLNVSARTVRRLVQSGDLRAVDLCSAPRIRVADLATFVERLEPR